MRHRLVSAVSIGFQPLQSEDRPDGGKLYLKWRWCELSLVTIGANDQATIEAVRTPAEEMVECVLRAQRAARPVTRAAPSVVVRLHDN